MNTLIKLGNEPHGKHRRRRARTAVRTVSLALIALLIATTTAAINIGAAPQRAVATTELEAPELVKLLSFNDRQDDSIDEFRADFVLKVPRGFVHPETGELQPVNGLYLRLGFDYSHVTRSHLRYTRTMGRGEEGANEWAKNVGQYYTVQKVVPSGRHDFLVISAEGDRNIPANSSTGNTPGGLLSTMNLYFGYEPSPPTSTSSAWTNRARTVQPLEYYAYYGANIARSVVGPALNIQYDATASLWSRGQASWGMSLDHGVNGWPAGVVPPNSISIDLINPATRSANVEKGPAGSVADRYWYAWVHEDGSLVTALNTAPIHVTGVVPRIGGTSAVTLISKNIDQISTAPQLGWTEDQAAQGLTARTGVDGSVDMRDAGGSGFYRLLVWPESRDPHEPNADHGAPRILYEAGDLFDANGFMTPQADLMKFTPATVFNNYQFALPEPPVITDPVHDSWLSSTDSLPLSGTGTPGHTISLKLAEGRGITSFTEPGLTTIIDGDHVGVEPGDVVVDATGTWNYTYTPPAPFTNGSYTVVAAQTDQGDFGWHATSGMSNPQPDTDPPQWGVTVLVDTEPPTAPSMECPSSPTSEGALTITGGGVEKAARVYIIVDGERVGEATVSVDTWTYTFDPPLGNGDYTLSAVQEDQAGNLSPTTDPTCALRVAHPVTATGEKTILPVAFANEELVDIDASNWDITATHGEQVLVLNGAEPVRLERDTEYTLGERLRASPEADPLAVRYAAVGSPECTDAAGVQLPPEVMDPSRKSLLITSEDNIAEPIRCTLANQTAHVTLTTLRLGGQPTPPGAGWSLELTADDGSVTSTLAEAASSARFRPGQVSLSPTVPETVSYVGLQMLDLSQPECPALATHATDAPRTCWLDVPSGEDPTVSLDVGTHGSFRIVAATPADLPALPMTGGIGSATYWLAGASALGIAGLVYLRRRHLDRTNTTPDRRSPSP